jgi:K+-transporting ATPase c subunit
MIHLRANLLLLALTLLICGVGYPLAIWGLGQGLFPTTANGSLKGRGDGTERSLGSDLIAQPFTAPGYFWPRPSAAGYNAAAAGGSNWGANNPKLRERVAQQLGAMIRYKKGSVSAGPDPAAPRTPQQDIEIWFAARPNRDAEHRPVDAEPTIATNFFDSWLQDESNRAKVADLESVPADMVTASGSGLDPHITLRNALGVYQLDRVAAARAGTTTDFISMRERIEDLVRRHTFTPLSQLVGEPIVNVLPLNADLDANFPLPAR